MIDKEHWDYVEKILTDAGIPPLPEDEEPAVTR